MILTLWNECLILLVSEPHLAFVLAANGDIVDECDKCFFPLSLVVLFPFAVSNMGL